MDTDPLQTLRTTIINAWNANSDLDADIDTIGGKDKEVLISTGWYDDSLTLPQVTITENGGPKVPLNIGYTEIWRYLVYDFNCWVPIQRLTGKGPGEAKKWRFQMAEEVRRILKANRTGLTDIKEVVLDGVDMAIDELDRSPPILRYLIQATVVRDI